MRDRYDLGVIGGCVASSSFISSFKPSSNEVLVEQFMPY